MGFVSKLFGYRISYGMIFVMTYIFYLVHLLRIDLVTSIIVPHPIPLLVSWLSGILMMVAMQELDHYDVSSKKIVLWQFLALIPYLLLVYWVRSKIKELKQENEEFLIILGMYVIYVVNLILSIMLIAVVVLIIVVNFNINIILMMFYASLGLGGLSTGYQMSKIRTETPDIIEHLQSEVLSPLVGQQRHRIRTAIVLLLIQLVMVVIDMFVPLTPRLL